MNRIWGGKFCFWCIFYLPPSRRNKTFPVKGAILLYFILFCCCNLATSSNLKLFHLKFTELSHIINLTYFSSFNFYPYPCLPEWLIDVHFLLSWTITGTIEFFATLMSSLCSNFFFKVSGFSFKVSYCISLRSLNGRYLSCIWLLSIYYETHYTALITLFLKCFLLQHVGCQEGSGRKSGKKEKNLGRIKYPQEVPNHFFDSAKITEILQNQKNWKIEEKLILGCFCDSHRVVRDLLRIFDIWHRNISISPKKIRNYSLANNCVWLNIHSKQNIIKQNKRE